ncbi:DUF7475 family protein [Halococcus sediminicola]|uniref:DUF7475 family protein n=1 Tax=Halococcus sediminicola TaxID=1264579 RepID=UPI00067977A2|nr:hypothetical protein [Halococcus sediminicola]
MATRADSRFSRPSMRTLDYVAIALVVITGVIHLYEGVEDWGEPIAIWFLLAGVGFFGAIVLFWLGVSRTLLYLGGVVFTGIQVVAYIVLNWPDIFSVIGTFDKIVQLVLIGTLVVLYQQYRERS